ncbi:MAG: argininosuccinate synthase [Dehalococcoidia bacterium]
MAEKIVLAYSGGLDTSVAVRWLHERYGMDVVTMTADLGGEGSVDGVREKALQAGAVNAHVVDARQRFVDEYIVPALQAGALYQGVYPLATALGRPLIARLLVDTARKEGATAVAHGCTGKGNDQVRLDVSVQALAPDLKIVAPAREWEMTDRAIEIAYAKKHGIPVPVTVDRPYSIDENLWGRSIEGGILEDAGAEPPEEVYAWTRSPGDAPDEPAYVEVSFARGVPVALNGEDLDGVSLIRHMNALAGEHGVGRIDHIEDRLVGIKSREIYEAPAATVLGQAHRALEALTLSKDQIRFKARVAQEYADLVYNGLWFTAMRQDLAAYVRSTQRYVSGTVRVRLHKGAATVVGRQAEASLYRRDLSTYGDEDAFDHQAAEGFIHLWGLPARTQAQAQPLGEEEAS